MIMIYYDYEIIWVRADQGPLVVSARVHLSHETPKAYKERLDYMSIDQNEIDFSGDAPYISYEAQWNSRSYQSWR